MVTRRARNAPQYARKRLLLAVMLAVFGATLANGFLERPAFVSSEVEFADASASGLSIMPASCESAPPYIHPDVLADIQAQRFVVQQSLQAHLLNTPGFGPIRSALLGQLEQLKKDEREAMCGLEDMCPNFAGLQSEVPVGMARDAAGNCIPTGDPLDMCNNITGTQYVVPVGYTRDANGNCIPSDPPIVDPDMCLNLDGVQLVVPAGMTRNAAGNCITGDRPDMCLNLDGVQLVVPDGYTRDEAGNCTTTVCDPNQGKKCESERNSCDMYETGTIKCDGTCSAVKPSDSLCSGKDMCLNLDGVQLVVPDGYTRDEAGNCITQDRRDMCLNIDGVQLVVPDGYTRDANGNCNRNRCPNGSEPDLLGNCPHDPPGSTALCSISAAPAVVRSGDPSTLTWTSLNALSASLSPGGAVPVNGSQNVSPSAKNMYTLTVQGASNTSSCRVEVDVGNKCPAGFIQSGTTCIRGCIANYFCDGSAVKYKNASCSVSTVETCDYGCNNGICNPPPTPAILEWRVRPLLVRSGDSVRIAWNVANVRSCLVEGSNGDRWVGATGAKDSSPITGQTTYTLSCVSLPRAVPATLGDTATVNIIPVFMDK